MRTAMVLAMCTGMLVACPVSEAALSVKVLPDGHVQIIESSPNMNARSRRAHTERVVAQSPNHVRRASAFPTNDPTWNYDWWNGQHTITRSVESWPILGQGDGVVVAVIDSGVNASHPDLAGQTVAGWDFVDSDADPSDPFGHGTHVAGIIAATADNGVGIVGIMPKAKIMPLRVLDKNGSGSDATIAKAIIWATDHGAHSLNLSLGGDETSPVLDRALQYARSQGTLPVCAAGNSGSTVDWPAASAQCMPVRALDAGGDRITSWSNRGLSSDGKLHGLSAPGTSIWSTYLDNGIAPMDGTSMATPVAAAAAGLLVKRGLAPDDAQRALEMSARDIELVGPDKESGYGALDLLQLARIQSGQAPPKCRAKVLQLVPGHNPWQQVDLRSVCAGRTLRVESLRPQGRIDYIEADHVLHFQLHYNLRWQMNRITIDLADETDPLAQPVLLTIMTPPQPGWISIQTKRCGISASSACVLKSARRGAWAVRGTWSSRWSPPGTRVRLQLMRMADEATDSAATRMSGPSSFAASLSSANFDPGLYTLTPARGALRGKTFYVRVT